MTEEYNKLFKRRIEIDGVVDDLELKMAGDVLFYIYNKAASIVNNGGVEQFNSNWADKHPNWDYKDESRQDEYIGTYEHYFKQIADIVANDIGSPYKLKENEPCLINPKEGWFVIRGYTESN